MIGAASTFVGSVAHTGRSESWVPDMEPPIIGWTASSEWAQALSELLQCWRSSGEIIFQVISNPDRQRCHSPGKDAVRSPLISASRVTRATHR